LPKVQTSRGFVALTEKIYNEKPILTDFSVSGEDLQHHCFRKEYYLKTVTQPDIDAVLQSWAKLLL
jgi:hypothetical protein